VEKWKRISEKMKNAKQSVSGIPLPLRKFQQVSSSAILSRAKKLEEAVIEEKKAGDKIPFLPYLFLY